MNPDNPEQRLKSLEEEVGQLSNLVCSLWYALYDHAEKPMGDSANGFLLWLGTRHEKYDEFGKKEMSKIADSNNPT